MAKLLIVNADDFGLSAGVNRGILECHVHGLVTSASLMVTGSAAREAASLSRDHPELAVGLHWDVWGEDEREFDLGDDEAVRAEFHWQLEEFHRLVGRMPTHFDSHRHAHRAPELMPLFRELVEPLGIPVRGDGCIRFVGRFYAQSEWRVTNLEQVSVGSLQRMLREEVTEGWTEFSCHPGYVPAECQWVYGTEREEEIRTLTDPRVRQTVEDLDVRLTSYSDFLAANART